LATGLFAKSALYLETVQNELVITYARAMAESGADSPARGASRRYWVQQVLMNHRPGEAKRSRAVLRRQAAVVPPRPRL
jgi:hypothetical protein